MKERDGCREGGRSTLEECPSHPCREGQVEAPSRNLTVAGDKCPGIFQSQAQGSLFPLPLEKECIWTGVRCVLGRPSFVLFSPFWPKKSQHSRQLWPGQQVRVHSRLEGRQSPTGAVGAWECQGQGQSIPLPGPLGLYLREQDQSGGMVQGLGSLRVHLGPLPLKVA